MVLPHPTQRLLAVLRAVSVATLPRASGLRLRRDVGAVAAVVLRQLRPPLELVRSRAETAIVVPRRVTATGRARAPGAAQGAPRIVAAREARRGAGAAVRTGVAVTGEDRGEGELGITRRLRGAVDGTRVVEPREEAEAGGGGARVTARIALGAKVGAGVHGGEAPRGVGVGVHASGAEEGGGVSWDGWKRGDAICGDGVSKKKKRLRARNQSGRVGGRVGEVDPLLSFYLIFFFRLEMLCGDDCMRRIN